MLTIAHRLQTIMKSDKVLVMSDGKVGEFDHPDKLLQNPKSHFTKLVEEMQKDEEKRKAEEAEKEKEKEEEKAKEEAKKAAEDAKEGKKEEEI